MGGTPKSSLCTPKSPLHSKLPPQTFILPTEGERAAGPPSASPSSHHPWVGRRGLSPTTLTPQNGGDTPPKKYPSPKGVPLFRLLDSLDDGFVNAEADGDGEQGQGEVGDHADGAEGGQGEEEEEAGAEDDPSLPHIPPEEEVVDCWGHRGDKGGVTWGALCLPTPPITGGGWLCPL